MRAACLELTALSLPLPSPRLVPEGKIVRLLTARQANVLYT